MRGKDYLQGQGDLVGRSITPITFIVIHVSPILIYLLSPPEPPKVGCRICGLEVRVGVQGSAGISQNESGRRRAD